MSTYGIIVKDTSGNIVKLTPDIPNVVSVGQETMPDSLVDTDKYYVSVDLPGTDSIPIDNVCCILNAFLLQVNIVAVVYNIGASGYPAFCFADDSVTNYTKNLSTGVMTVWVPGDCTPSTDKNSYDPFSTIYPDVYRDKLSDSGITAVKMFAAMRYHVNDANASSYIDAYQIGTQGVNKVDYAISMRRTVTT